MANNELSKSFGELDKALDELRSEMKDVTLVRGEMEDGMASAGADASADPVPAVGAGISFVDHPRPSAGAGGPMDDILSTLKSMSSMSAVGMEHGAPSGAAPGGLISYATNVDGEGQSMANTPGFNAGYDPRRSVQMLSSKEEYSKPLMMPSEAEAGVGSIKLDNEWGMELRQGDDMGSMAAMQQGSGDGNMMATQSKAGKGESETGMPSMNSGSVSTVGSSRPGMAKSQAKSWAGPREPSRPNTLLAPNFAGDKDHATRAYAQQLNKSVKLVFGADGLMGAVPPAPLVKRVENTLDETIAKSYEASQGSYAPVVGNYNATSAITRKHSCKFCGASKPAFITACLNCMR